MLALCRNVFATLTTRKILKRVPWATRWYLAGISALARPGNHYTILPSMHKIIAGILLLLNPAALFSQGSRPLLGIPSLAIKSNIPSTSLAPARLLIETNQLITGLTNCNCLSGCAVLPVKLLSFEGRRVNTALVQLDWKTANEYQNKGFEVQRSLGNTREFRPIAFVPAQTTGGLRYEYALPDNNGFSGISYYRLKQIDLNEAFTFSETIAIKGYDKEASLSLYPNPVSDKLTANIFSLLPGTAVLSITDATQKKLYTQTLRLNKGLNLIALPARSLLSGVYFVQVVSEEMNVLSGKFIKL
ncbi:MAG: T9SS type A sorting domain-containing protein [Chitinophagaceae bacterium]|nr:MAG: T9SS type A sorting domain-containing protein [Chitinophagaceae bacterium]